MRRKLTAAAGIAALALLTACGAAHSSSFQNTPVAHTYNPAAIRLDTPGNFQAVMRICDGTTAIYSGNDGGLMVVANSGACKGQKFYPR